MRRGRRVSFLRDNPGSLLYILVFPGGSHSVGRKTEFLSVSVPVRSVNPETTECPGAPHPTWYNTFGQRRRVVTITSFHFFTGKKDRVGRRRDLRGPSDPRTTGTGRFGVTRGLSRYGPVGPPRAYTTCEDPTPGRRRSTD